MSRLLFLLIFCLLNHGCANYIGKVHRQLDRETGVKRRAERSDKFDQFRRPKKLSSRGMPNRLSTNTVDSISPSVKRLYRPQSVVKRRLSADDLNDNSSDGSLWGGQGTKANYLFTINEKRKFGDIVIIEVLGKMKNEVTMELKRAFPPRPRPKKKKEEDNKTAAAASAENAAPAADESDQDVAEGGGKVYDKISSVIVEEINSNHFLLRGQKNVLFQNRKRLIEVQALVAKRDIKDNDTVSSDAILEKNITVIK